MQLFIVVDSGGLFVCFSFPSGILERPYPRQGGNNPVGAEEAVRFVFALPRWGIKVDFHDNSWLSLSRFLMGEEWM